MASNTSFDYWSVQIINLPASITEDQLAQRFLIPKGRIKVPAIQQFSNYCAWINYFGSEREAKDFVDQWSGSSIFGTYIKCNAFEPKNGNTNVHSASSRLANLSIETHANQTSYNRPPKYSPNIGFEPIESIPRSSDTPTHRMSPNMTRAPNAQRPSDPDPRRTPPHLQSRVPNSSPTKISSRNTGDGKRLLCPLANKGACEQGSIDCKYRHQRCPNFEACSSLNCDLAHAKRNPSPKPYPSTSGSNNNPHGPRIHYSIDSTGDSHSLTSSFHSTAST